MKHKLGPRSVPAALLAALLSLSAVAAQERPPTGPQINPEARFQGSAEQVVAVEVPVNVVGRDGQPVRGLSAADFEVFDDGDRQPLTGFEVVDLAALGTGDTRARTPAPAGAAATPTRFASEEDLEPLGSTERRHFLLLFDLSFSNPTAILKARLAARDFLLRSLHPSDLAAVVTFSLETGPQLVLTFTPDRAQLARAIDTLGMRRLSENQAKLDPLHFLIERPDIAIEAGGSGSGGGREDLVDLKAEAERVVSEALNAISKSADKSQKAYDRGRIKSFTRAFGDMARALDAVKGRKHLIYFSEGFDSRLVLGRDPIGKEVDEENLNIEFGRHDLVDTDNRFGSTEMQGAVNAMLEQFRRADCVIQAVDIGGLRAGADISESTHTTGQDALFYMANETGGQLFKDANDLGGELERVLERTSVTYLLTFQRSDLKPDGAYHRLRVKAKLPPGARLSHRTGYYAPRPFAQLDPLERSLIASDGIASAAPRRDLEMSLLAAPFRNGGGLAYVPVILEVGGAGLLAGQKGGRMSVEIYTYVSDAKGEMKDFFSQMVAVDLSGPAREMLASSGLKYYGHLDLPPGRYRVRALVRNAETGRTGVESVPLEVPAMESGQPYLLPPLFFEKPGRWLMVREQTGAGRQDSVVYPFTVNGEPYVPSARAALPGGGPARLCLVGYNFGQGDLAVDAQVLDAAGKPLGPDTGTVSLDERTPTGIPGVDKLLATFRPAGLKPGHYTLAVGVTDRASGRRGASSIPFAVVN